jgi:hypothetical protein
MKNKSVDEVLYDLAVKTVGNLVDYVLAEIEDTADLNHFEKAWVLEEYQKQFQRKRKEVEWK